MGVSLRGRRKSRSPKWSMSRDVPMYHRQQKWNRSSRTIDRAQRVLLVPRRTMYSFEIVSEHWQPAISNPPDPSTVQLPPLPSQSSLTNWGNSSPECQRDLGRLTRTEASCRYSLPDSYALTCGLLSSHVSFYHSHRCSTSPSSTPDSISVQQLDRMRVGISPSSGRPLFPAGRVSSLQ